MTNPYIEDRFSLGMEKRLRSRKQESKDMKVDIVMHVHPVGHSSMVVYGCDEVLNPALLGHHLNNQVLKGRGYLMTMADGGVTYIPPSLLKDAVVKITEHRLAKVSVPHTEGMEE